MRRILPALAAAVLGAGCGYNGDPLPPLANVPARVDDLAAVERGSRIIVRFTVPQLTTEGMPIKTPVKLDLRIGVAGEPFHAEEWAARAAPVSEGPVENGIARYEIPAAEWTGKQPTIAVRVVGAGRKQAGWSNFVRLTVIRPPEAPGRLTIDSTAAGIWLKWGGPPGSFRIFRSAGEEKFAPVADVDQPEWTDRDTEFGKRYTYRVQRIVKLGDGREAESEPSEALGITPEDRFAPAAPSGLRAAAAPNSIELAWEANAEPDLAGYRVYRALPGGAFEKIAGVSQAPGYSDRSAAHGKTYRYAVTAIDNAGNESKPSAAVEVLLP